MLRNCFALAVLTSLALVNVAFAIPEQGYEEGFITLVQPLVASAETGRFEGEAGVSIHYQLFPHARPKGAVVVSNGYTENYQKYAEVAFDLHRAGYSVFLFDHRGQGGSSRLLKNPNLGYIDRFDYLVSDLHTFVQNVVKPRVRAGAPLFLLAHSMGGAVATRYLEEHAGEFSAAVLSAPMFGIKLGSWDPGVAKAILRTLEFFGQGQAVAIGSEQANPANQPFEENELTHSRARYRMARAAIRQNPGAIIEAATNSWVLRAMLGGEAALSHAGRLKLPILLFQAEKDTFVTPDPQDEFCRVAPACRKETFAGASHEVLMESDKIRDQAMQSLLRFFGEKGRP